MSFNQPFSAKSLQTESVPSVFETVSCEEDRIFLLIKKGQKASFSISDERGKVVHRGDLLESRVVIDTSDFKPGRYELRLLSREGYFVEIFHK